MGRAIEVNTTATLNALADLGNHIHQQRRIYGLTTTELATAAGISRVTLHRIETGAQSVTAGAYASVLHALGEKIGTDSPTKKPELPQQIKIANFPELKKLAWQIKSTAELTPNEAWKIYTRNWRYIDQELLSKMESELIKKLQENFEGSLHV
jgi:transcriptional regulator with XRE-family HTH domain